MKATLKLKTLLKEHETADIIFSGIRFKALINYNDLSGKIKLNIFASSSKDLDKLYPIKENVLNEIEKKLKTYGNFNFLGYGSRGGAGYAFEFDVKQIMNNIISDILNTLK